MHGTFSPRLYIPSRCGKIAKNELQLTNHILAVPVYVNYSLILYA
jgi:hypothetical protein